VPRKKVHINNFEKKIGLTTTGLDLPAGAIGCFSAILKYTTVELNVRTGVAHVGAVTQAISRVGNATSESEFENLRWRCSCRPPHSSVTVRVANWGCHGLDLSTLMPRPRSILKGQGKVTGGIEEFIQSQSSGRGVRIRQLPITERGISPITER
jgi:hypothetical protein